MTDKKPSSPGRDKPDGAGNVAEILRQRIADNDLPAGTRLREQELARDFSVSRARIRDALSILEERGLVERTPNKGAIVTMLEPQQVSNVYSVREVLEGLCVREATKNVPPEHWEDLVALFDTKPGKAIAEGRFEIYVECLAVFRERTVEAADNEVLAYLMDTLYDRTRALIRRLVIVPGRAAEGLRDHQAVLAAMRRGDAEEAERLKRENIRSAAACFHRYRRFLL